MYNLLVSSILVLYIYFLRLELEERLQFVEHVREFEMPCANSSVLLSNSVSSLHNNNIVYDHLLLTI